jgi:hypothetical protein
LFNEREEEDLPFPTLFQPFSAATEPNSAFCNLNLQIPQTLKVKSNPKQAYPKMQLRVFFFYCTLFRKYNLNQLAFNQILLQFPYLLSADKDRLAELSGKKGKTGNILRFLKSFFPQSLRYKN